MAMAAMEAVRRCVARRGGSRRRGGAHGLLRCSRGARWLRLRRAVASVAFGRERERDRGEDAGEGECEGVGVAAWRRPGHPDEEGRGRQAGREEVAQRGGARASGTRRPPVGEEDDRGGGARWAGPPAGWAGLLRLGCTGEAPGKPLLLLFLFSIFF